MTDPTDPKDIVIGCLIACIQTLTQELYQNVDKSPVDISDRILVDLALAKERYQSNPAVVQYLDKIHRQLAPHD